MNKQNLAWLLVILGGIVEIFWVSGLKYANSPLWIILTVIGIAFSFVAMLIAVRTIEVSIGYAVFVGIGTLGVVISEIVIFNQHFTVFKLILIFTLLIGVIGLKLVSKHHGTKHEDDVVQDIGESIRLNTPKNS